MREKKNKGAIYTFRVEIAFNFVPCNLLAQVWKFLGDYIRNLAVREMPGGDEKPLSRGLGPCRCANVGERYIANVGP